MTGEKGFATDGAGSILHREDPDDRARDDAADGEGADTGDSTASEFAGRNLVVGYPSAAEPVIDDESVRIPPGEVTALVGPNGSGKSTLLKALADQLPPDRGTVRLDGTDIEAFGTKELARKLGLLSQENVAPNGITVERLIAHGRYPHRGTFESLTEADREAIERAIALAGVEHLRSREVGSLSGGQQQLVWIAMALAQETDVLLLDEPTTFLDMQHQLQVMEIVERLRDERSVTVVLVLHDVEQAARHADHLVALEDGEVYARGPPEAVVTEALLADVFGVDASVSRTDHGPRVTPLAPLSGEECGRKSATDGGTE